MGTKRGKISGWWHAQTIERKLPAAFTLLLTGLVAFYVLTAYRSVQANSDELAGARLTAVSSELARIASTNNETRSALVKRIVGQPAVRSALAGDRTTNVDTALRRLRVGTDSSATYLLDANQQVVRQLGEPAPQAALNELKRALGDALELRGDLAVGRLFAAGDRAYYWQTIALRDG